MKNIILSLFTVLGLQLIHGEGTKIGDLYYNLNSTTKTAEVTYSTSNSPRKGLEVNYPGLTTASIPTTVSYNGLNYSVTSIGIYAFYWCSGLTSITIPNSVTSIRAEAFYRCTSLTSVTIPNSVTSIREYAFYGCSGLTNVTIPNSVTSIEEYAFYGCSGLTSVTIPNSVTSIREYAFYGCSGLTSVTIPNSVTSIREYAFYGCSGLTSVTIPNSVTSIGNSAFSGCSGLTSVTIPNSVISIGEYAFDGCSGLTTVNFNAENCTSCGSSNKPTFPNGLSTLNIGNNVKNIPDYAFYKCSSLSSVTIPNSVTSIGSYAFYGCSGLTSVTIPNSVTTIGDEAFVNCSGLTSIKVDDGNPSYASREGVLYTKDLDILIYCPAGKEGSLVIPTTVTSIGDEAFVNCSGLTNVTIPNSVTSIGRSAFINCTGLSSVTIPNSVTSIELFAFYGCRGLTSVTIPPSVTSIGLQAFNYCTGLVKNAYPNTLTNPFSNGISIAYPKNSELTEDGLIYDAGKKTLLFVPIDYTNETVIIPNSVTSIGGSAFEGCNGLTSVTIPPSVTEIGKNAFYGCRSLVKNAYPNTLTNPFSYGISIAYPRDSELTEDGLIYDAGKKTLLFVPIDYTNETCIIPNSVTSIGDYAFEGCSGLTSVTIPPSVTSIGANAFRGCSGLNRVDISDIPAWCKINFNNTFTNPLYYAHHLYLNGQEVKDLVIPDSVTSIGSYAFVGCSGLKSIYFNSEQLLNLGRNAFSECNDIESIYCNTKRPPVADDFSVFANGVYSSASLYVPSKDLSLYYSMVPWSKFFNIVGTDEFPEVDAVQEIQLDNEETYTIFNLNGVLIKKDATKQDLDELTPGIYIINGRKVVRSGSR